MTTQTHRELHEIVDSLDNFITDCKEKVTFANSLPTKSRDDQHAVGMLSGLALLAITTKHLAQVLHKIATDTKA